MHDIITIGTATRDILILSEDMKTFKNPHFAKHGFTSGEAACFPLGSKILIDKPVFTTGGGATNTATTFARMGLKTAALVKIGDDEAGMRIEDEFKREGITSLAIKDPKLATAYSVILRTSGGERTILAYVGASEKLSSGEIDLAPLRSRWAYIVPGKLPFSTIRHAISHLASQGAYVAINPSKHLIDMGIDKLRPILKHTKVLILNREEASYLTGLPYAKSEAIFAALHTIGTPVIVMTDGKAGVLVSDHARIYRAGTFKEKRIVDRTGAGDAFGSGFVSGLILRGEQCIPGRIDPETISYAIRLGSANGTAKIEHVGAKYGILTLDEFKHDPRWKQLPITVTTAKNVA